MGANIVRNSCLTNDLIKKCQILRNVQFYGGCNGNTQGVATLVEGMKADDVIAKLEGIRCGFKGTSCPDQLAKAIRQAMEQ